MLPKRAKEFRNGTQEVKNAELFRYALQPVVAVYLVYESCQIFES